MEKFSKKTKEDEKSKVVALEEKSEVVALEVLRNSRICRKKFGRNLF